MNKAKYPVHFALCIVIQDFFYEKVIGLTKRALRIRHKSFYYAFYGMIATPHAQIQTEKL